MSKRIRSMIDGIFSEMKMTAENLALRDELMDNALSRYADAISQGRSEEEAFEEVASSLEDIQGLLDEMNRMDAQPPQMEEEETAPELETGAEEQEAYHVEDASKADLSDALNKAFSALGDFSHTIVPEAKKLVKEVDGATGGVLSKLGRAAKKGVRSAKKAAEEALDKLSQGENVFDFGAKKPEAREEFVSEFDMDVPEQTEQPEEKSAVPEAVLLREQAKDLRAEAAIKDVTGDREGAQALMDHAQALETRADLLEQATEIEAACAAAQEAEVLIKEAEQETETAAESGAEEAVQDEQADDAAAFNEQQPDDEGGR